MSRRSRFPWLIIIGIILLVILIAALFLFSPSPKPVPIPSRAIITSMDFVAAPTTPQPPSCTVAINGQKIPPPSSAYGQYLHTGGDVTELRVSVTECGYDLCFLIGNKKN